MSVSPILVFFLIGVVLVVLTPFVLIVVVSGSLVARALGGVFRLLTGRPRRRAGEDGIIEAEVVRPGPSIGAQIGGAFPPPKSAGIGGIARAAVVAAVFIGVAVVLLARDDASRRPTHRTVVSVDMARGGAAGDEREPIPAPNAPHLPDLPRVPPVPVVAPQETFHVEGLGVAPAGRGNAPQARELAERAALTDARRQLLEQLADLELVTGETLRQTIERRGDATLRRVEGALDRVGRVTGRRVDADGGVRVTLQATLDDVADVVRRTLGTPDGTSEFPFIRTATQDEPRASASPGRSAVHVMLALLLVGVWMTWSQNTP